MAEKTVNGSTSNSPVMKTTSSPPQPAAENKSDNEVKKEGPSNATQPLAPPPRPSNTTQNQGGDYFSQTHEQPNPPPHLLYEPNPFDASFSGQTTTAGGDIATPGGTKLPPVAALTSPASLLPGGATPNFWGASSLRSGPLSPAMLAGPASDYFSDGHGYRGGFGSGVTPNESSLRTGLTPGGGGSMFPSVSSPNSAALFNLNGGATPGTLDFHRTAVNAAAMQKQNASQSQQQNVTSQPQNQSNGATNGNADKLTHQHPDPFGQGDANDAANGLFLLAQAQPSQREGQNNNGYVMAQQQAVRSQQQGNQSLENSPTMRTRNQHGSGGAQRQGSIGSNAASDESEQQHNRPNTRTRGKRGGAAAQSNGRRKAEDTPTKPPPNKKSKGSNGTAQSHMEPEPQSEEEPEQDMNKDQYNSNGKKMTDDEKRKNFLERNRVAALKCRQRKKQWLANLQHKCEMFSSENETLQGQIHQMREELVHLKTMLLAHKDCSLTQQQGVHMESLIASFPPTGYENSPGMAPGPPGMYNQMVPPQQPLMNGGDMDRRYS